MDRRSRPWRRRKDVGQALWPIVVGLLLPHVRFETTFIMISIVLVLIFPITYLRLRS